jgi:hypothetical protein
LALLGPATQDAPDQDAQQSGEHRSDAGDDDRHDFSVVAYIVLLNSKTPAWRGAELIYAGMSGQGAQSEDFVARPDQPTKVLGLWTRLNSHASGRRSGDQFNIYICDRFIVPALWPPDEVAVRYCLPHCGPDASAARKRR